jgi:hypothetical protein
MHQKFCSRIIVPFLEHVLVVVPLLNEEIAIATVVHNLQSYGLTKIRVVDNGGCDRH